MEKVWLKCDLMYHDKNIQVHGFKLIPENIEIKYENILKCHKKNMDIRCFVWLFQYISYGNIFFQGTTIRGGWFEMVTPFQFCHL